MGRRRRWRSSPLTTCTPPWVIPATLLDTFIVSHTAMRYRSALIGFAVHAHRASHAPADRARLLTPRLYPVALEGARAQQLLPVDLRDRVAEDERQPALLQGGDVGPRGHRGLVLVVAASGHDQQRRGDQEAGDHGRTLSPVRGAPVSQLGSRYGEQAGRRAARA
jgi:hypothetical protein